MSRISPNDVLAMIVLHGEITRGRLAEELRSNKQTVRHHIRLLLDSGAIVITRETETHASSLKWYGVPTPHAGWRDLADSLSTRVYKAAERELKILLDEWGAWTAHRMPNGMLEDVDRQISALPSYYRLALAKAHHATHAWRGAKIDHDNSYRFALARLLPLQKRKLRAKALPVNRCQKAETLEVEMA